MLSEIFELLQVLRRPRWPAEKMAAYRRRKLRRLIDHAYQGVPYYRELMERNGIRPEEIRDFPDLARLPVSTKAMLRAAGPDTLARGAGNLITQHTSGHSGTPFAVHCTPEERQTRRLREFRMLLTAGQLSSFDQLVLLGPTTQRPRRLHRTLGFYRMDVIPCTLAAAELTARLLATRPDVLWVYPTSLKTVLYHTGKPLSEICRPRTMITSSQVMDLPFRERLLAGNPGMEIVDIYGASEVGRIASACELRNGLHLDEDALHVELLADGQPVPAGQPGSVTVTALDQLAMPFIRYELGDLCRLRLDECGCGRPSARVDPPAGRNADMATLPDGTKTSCAPLDIVLRGETDLVQYRFVQTSRKHIRAELFYPEAPSASRLDEMRKNFSAHFDDQIDFTIELMANYRTDGQKFKVFISELDGDPQ
jgi:phenylacetate-CoA ligase